jgi:hypothetical protein
VCLNEGTAEGFVRTSCAIVGALGGGETSLGPPERGVVESEEGVLLLNSEPGLEVLGLLQDGVGGSTGVGRERSAIGLVCITYNKDVVSSAEGVLEDGACLDDHFGIVSWGLTSAGTIIVPLWQLLRSLRDSLQSPRLASQVLSRPSDPHIFNLDGVYGLGEFVVLFKDLLVEFVSLL